MSFAPNPSDDLIAFIDSNIVLEGKPFADLPWDILSSEGTIKLLIVPKAMEEIDAKKRDGRLGPYARAFNRLIAKTVIDGSPAIIRESNPRVELQLASCSRIIWSDFDDLDPDDGDGRIVAEALHVRGIASTNRVFISHDIKPLAFARGRGLRVHHVCDDWLRSPEPHPRDKEVQRLKQQLAELKKDEPSFQISVEVLDDIPLLVRNVAPLTVEQVAELIKKIRSRNRRIPNGESDIYGFKADIWNERDSSYDGKYRQFIDKIVPNFAANFNRKLELLVNQRKFSVRVINDGQIRADHLVITISLNGHWMNQHLVHVSHLGPKAPVPRPNMYGMTSMMLPTRDLRPLSVGRHEFDVIRPARKSREIEVSCEDFRTGQAFHYEGFLLPSTDIEPIEIKVSITAKNLRGEFVQEFKFEKQFVDCALSDLMDWDAMRLLRRYPTQSEFERLMAAELYDDIEWDEDDNNS